MSRKRLTWPLILGALLWPAWLEGAEDQPAATQPASAGVFKTEKEKWSYCIGLNLASNIKTGNLEVDVDALARAMRDVLSGGQTLVTEAEARQILMDLGRRMREEFQKKQAELGEKNKKEAEKFLAENQKKEGVKTTASGLQYEVLKAGDGATPKADDRVRVEYKGMLTDGKEFDSSHGRGEPSIFHVSRVIKGWSEALQLMKVGDKWRLVIPPELGYGPRGDGRNIPPNSVLMFEVELLGIEPAAPTTRPATRPMP